MVKSEKLQMYALYILALKLVHESVASTLSGILLEMQILDITPNLVNQNLHFNKSSIQLHINVWETLLFSTEPGLCI